jgi:hypothetical protein
MTRSLRSEYLVFGAPAIGDAEIEEVTSTLRSGWLGTGLRVARFEEEFASYDEAFRDLPVGRPASVPLALTVLRPVSFDVLGSLFTRTKRSP